MPSILSDLVEEVAGNDLDEKARQALTVDVNNVNALSILQRLSATRDQVRNVSAFVATAVKKSPAKPGNLERDNAVQRLHQAGLLDDNAKEQLKNTTVDAACSALAALLSQQSGAVRNPSAYVCRNLKNTNTRGGGQEESYYEPPRDHRELPQYRSVPPPRAPAPAAYVEQSYAPHAETFSFFPGGLGGIDRLLAKWRDAIDQRAWESLMMMDAAALTILQELDSKGDQVRSPSAYIQRAVNNIKVPASRGGGHDGSFGGSGQVGGTRRAPVRTEAPGGLDENAKAALAAADPETAETIMSELESKGGAIRNPSAYVQRALSNASKGIGAAAKEEQRTQIRAFDEGLGEEMQAELDALPSPLDEKATGALEEVSQAAALKILRSLNRQAAQIGNASAWVCKAVGNERRGGGDMEPPQKRLRS